MKKIASLLLVFVLICADNLSAGCLTTQMFSEVNGGSNVLSRDNNIRYTPLDRGSVSDCLSNESLPHVVGNNKSSRAVVLQDTSFAAKSNRAGDSDGDGVDDANDSDDDNDGILDCVENGLSTDLVSAFVLQEDAQYTTGNTVMQLTAVTWWGFQRGQAWSRGQVDFLTSFKVSQKQRGRTN